MNRIPYFILPPPRIQHVGASASGAGGGVNKGGVKISGTQGLKQGVKQGGTQGGKQGGKQGGTHGLKRAVAPAARRRVGGGGVVNALAGELAKEREAPPGFVCLLFRPVYAEEPIDGLFTAEAYEPTEQCEELCSRGGLVPSERAGEAALAPGEGKSFQLQGKAAASLDTAYLAVRVFDSGRPHQSPLRLKFPMAGRGNDVRKLHLRAFLNR